MICYDDKMDHFEKLPLIFDETKLVETLHQVEEIAPWPEDFMDDYQNQICLTKKEGQEAPQCFYEGNGGVYRTMVDGREVLRQQEIYESEYNIFIPELEHTYFKEVYDSLREYVSQRYNGFWVVFG